jgi:hypothetical protein
VSSEFGLIRRLQAQAAKPDRQVALGIGDDTAILKTSPTEWTLMTTDLLAEGVHFDLATVLFGWTFGEPTGVCVNDAMTESPFSIGSSPSSSRTSLTLSYGAPPSAATRFLIAKSSSSGTTLSNSMTKSLPNRGMSRTFKNVAIRRNLGMTVRSA